jgi:serine/threonine protein kinase
MQWSGKDPNEVFSKEELLGEGAYGAVYRAVHCETDMVIAIKELPNLVNQEELQKEIDILKKCSHQNIVCYFGTCQLASSLWVPRATPITSHAQHTHTIRPIHHIRRACSSSLCSLISAALSALSARRF